MSVSQMSSILASGSGRTRALLGRRVHQWRQGLAQAVLYLVQAHEGCGTYLGTFVLESEFSRMVAHANVVYLEVAPGFESHAPKIIQELLENASVLSNAFPHDIAPQDSTAKVDTHGFSATGFQVFWDHVSRVRSIVEAIDIDDMPSRLQPLDIPRSDLHGFAFRNVIDHPANITPDVDNSAVSHIKLLELLRLAAAAHPKQFPRWWVDEKKRLIENGRPDDPVRRRSQQARPSTPSKLSSMTGPLRDEGEGDGNEGGCGGEGGAHSQGGDSGLGGGGDEGGDEGSRHNDKAVPDGGQSGGPRDGLSGDAASDAEGRSAARDIVDEHCMHGHEPNYAMWPLTHAGSSVVGFPPFTSPPESEEDEEASMAHCARWLRHQQAYVGASPILPAPSSADAPPTPNITPVQGRVPERLYAPEELLRSRPLVAPGSTGSTAICEIEDDAMREALLARVTLAGWRVRLVTSEEMDMLLQ
ncbi:unnamed protein product [Cutaneotrichosporon oleaginosum]